jgi:heme oxygenase
VTKVVLSARARTQPAVGLRDRLRAETAEVHVQVEAVADVAGSVRTRDDYVELLGRLSALHSGFEHRLAAEEFVSGWKALGLDIAAHRRAYLLTADIEKLGGPASLDAPGPHAVPRLATFGHALGCLYVLEGSALGGPVVAGIVQARIGEVPASFLTGKGRTHRGAWPALLGALSRFDVQGGDGDGVVAGACETFAAFADQLSRVPPRLNSLAHAQ